MNWRTSNVNPQSGQALLVLILIIALAITVVSAVSFRLTTEVQTTKSQEENVRVLAAADSGIEKGLQLANQPSTPSNYYEKYVDVVGGTLQALPGVDAQKSNLTITTTSGNQFISPEIPIDEQYTFYLWNYPATTNQNYFTGNLSVYFGSNGAGTCNATRTTPAIEISIIYGVSNDQVVRYLYEPCASGQYIGGINKGTIEAGATLHSKGTDYPFNWKTAGISIGSIQEPKLMIVRSLFGGTRIAFEGSAPLPEQGKIIRAEAVSLSGSSKVVSLFQSFPQIPADFFVTTF